MSGPPADRPDWTAARNVGRRVAEAGAIEAARQRRLAEEYREHLLWLRDELQGMQRAAGMLEHDCPICQQADAPVAPDERREEGT